MRHLRHNAVAYLALFVALGGTSFAAATVITGKNVKNGSLTGIDVRNRSLTGKDVKDKSLTPIDFSGSVQGPKGNTGAPGPKGDTGDTGPPGPADVKALSAVVPTGVSDQVAGELGPVKVLVSCLAGNPMDANHAITVKGQSSVAGAWRYANIHILPDGSQNSFVNSQSVTFINNSFNVDTVGFVFQGTDVRVAGNFIASYGPGNTGCIVAGTLAR